MILRCKSLKEKQTKKEEVLGLEFHLHLDLFISEYHQIQYGSIGSKWGPLKSYSSQQMKWMGWVVFVMIVK